MIYVYRSSPYKPKIHVQDTHRHGDWLRIEKPTQEETSILLSLGVDADIVSDALDPNEVPRIEQDGDWTYFITRLPDTDDDFNDFTTPILFAVGRKYILTVSRDTLGRLWQPFVENEKVPTSSQKQLFLAMMDVISRSYEKRVANINRQMRAVISDINRLRPKDIATLVEYERKLNDYLDALQPTNTSLEKIRAGKYMRLEDEDRDLVEALSVDMEQVIARCKSLLRTINNLRDSYRAVMDTRLNETMRILTVVTLVITIPTMLAGLYGMNVDLPGSNWKGTFFAVIGISGLAAGLIGYYFVKKR